MAWMDCRHFEMTPLEPGQLIKRGGKKPVHRKTLNISIRYPDVYIIQRTGGGGSYWRAGCRDPGETGRNVYTNRRRGLTPNAPRLPWAHGFRRRRPSSAPLNSRPPRLPPKRMSYCLDDGCRQSAASVTPFLSPGNAPRPKRSGQDP